MRETFELEKPGFLLVTSGLIIIYSYHVKVHRIKSLDARNFVSKIFNS